MSYGFFVLGEGSSGLGFQLPRTGKTIFHEVTLLYSYIYIGQFYLEGLPDRVLPNQF